MITELLAAYDRATPTEVAAGRAWYPMAADIGRRLAREASITSAQACGVLAAASLNQGWKGNQTIARRLAAGESVGLHCVRRECAAILAGVQPLHAIGGPKRAAFYRNIRGDTAAVTVDRWAARAAGAHQVRALGYGYDAIADAYAIAAGEAGETPRDFQAIVWGVVRGSHV